MNPMKKLTLKSQNMLH